MTLQTTLEDAVSSSLDAGDERAAEETPALNREVRFEYSHDLAQVLEQAQLTVLVSTYQAGKLCVLGTHAGQMSLGFQNFDRPMGVALNPDRSQLAVAARDRVWSLRQTPDVAKDLQPAGQYDACFLTRSAQLTGEIQSHEMAWGEDGLWVVNTLFSCLCRPDSHYSFVPLWRPPFITQLAAEDRCHLNGLAMYQGRPRFVTAMGETDVAGGWRETKARSGCVIDVDSGQTVARGFAMPHSPRVVNGQLWLLDSGRGALVRMDLKTGQAETAARFPGYTRGMAVAGNLAFIGLSKIRETSTFGGVPIAEHRDRLKCGVAVYDLARGELRGQFEFASGVDEIFDVSVLPGIRMPALRGPFAHEDGQPTVWVVPAQNK